MTEIERIIRSVLGDDVVQKVSFRPEVNADGERILVVEVVYDDTKQALDGADLASVTDKIWDYLSEQSDSAFPVTSFISSTDAAEFYAA